MITDWHFYVLAVPAVMLIGIAKSGFSGVGLISLPMLSLLIPPMQAAAIILPILMVQDIVGVIALRRDYSPRNLILIMMGGLCGVVLGMLLAKQVSDAEVMMMVGVVSCGFVIVTFLRKGGLEAPAKTGSVPAGLFWGLCAGFTSFIANAGAPPVQVYLTPQKLTPATYAGTFAILFAVLNYVKFAAFIWLGQVTLPNLQVSFVLFPLAIGSSLLGVYLIRRVKALFFYKIIYALTFIVGLKLIYDGVLQIWLAPAGA
jgi:uncharacterized membrane protein YfcA